jgi:hypothetical protein
MYRHLSFLPLIILLTTITPLYSTIIHVPDDSTTIQGGINGAVDEDTVMVAPGTYHEYEIDFLGKAITVTGTDPQDSAVVATTIVDAASFGRVFYFGSGEDSTSILTGLTITGGRISYGGGIVCYDSSPKITFNIISFNESTSAGGGIYCNNSNPVISNNIIVGNFGSIAGGGIACDFNSSPTITKNIIIGNTGVTSWGGGISCIRSNPHISNNIIADNSALWMGGGIYCYADSSSPTISNNIIIRNSVTGHIGDGGGIHCDYNSFPIIVNNTITGNTAFHWGGGIFGRSNANPTITNNIIWENNAPMHAELYFSGGNPPVTYSDIKGGWPGEGNIDADPLYIAPGFDNYYLRTNSPCIDNGDTTKLDSCRPPGIGGERSDMGAYGGENNCGWPPKVEVGLSISPSGSLTVPKGEFLYFDTFIQNNRENTVEGEFWISVSLPDSAVALIPENLLNYSNPLHGQVFGYSFVELSNQMFVPTQADTGSYQLIGRIGHYPGGIIDEESFGFQVVE